MSLMRGVAGQVREVYLVSLSTRAVACEPIYTSLVVPAILSFNVAS